MTEEKNEIINTDNKTQETLETAIESKHSTSNKKGRKIDPLRKSFTNENDRIKCTHPNCTKTFSCKTSLTTLKYHLVSHSHQQISDIKTNDNILNNNMNEGNINFSDNEIYKLFAIAFAKNSLPCSLLEDEHIKAALASIRGNNTVNLNKKKLKDIMSIESDKISNSLLVKLALNKIPVTLAIDGWTNVKTNKLTNLLLIAGGISYFYASIENIYCKNNTNWLVSELEEKIKDLQSRNVNVIAIAADNEKLMKSTCSSLNSKFPVLIPVPCAAHIIQLCLKKVCKIPDIKDTIDDVNEIIYLVRNNKEIKNKLHQLQLNDNITEPLKILNYTEIRWSTLIKSIKRIILLKKFLVEIIKESNLKTDNFWLKLDSLHEFLIFFETVTNKIQKDDATVYSVWENYNKLIDYYNNIDNTNNFFNCISLVVQVIKDKWNDHINYDLINATKWFSFECDYHLDDDTSNFIQEWGAHYLIQYSIIKDNDYDFVKKNIYIQITHFLSRLGKFINIDSDVLTLKETCKIINVDFNPKMIWSKFFASYFELSKIAFAILSICPTEAAERSFSTLSDIHTKARNRLKKNAVDVEMNIKYNFDKIF